jgi:acetoin utilization protein AcuB
VEYEQTELETRPVLVGLLTRSDLLIALARILGALEPGMQLVVLLPTGNLAPLTQTLLLTEELHIPVLSVLAAPKEGSTPRVATVRLGTINPAPLLVRMQKANIEYTLADTIAEGGAHV